VTVFARYSDVVRRPVTHTDTGFLRALFAESREDLIILPPDVRDGLVDMQFRAQRRHYDEVFPRAQHDILVAHGVDVGRLIVETSTAGVRIVDVSVQRAYRGRGVASAALTELLAQADRERRPARLSVWADNTDARRLYERLGFAVTAAAAGYLEMDRSPEDI
jgi:ribosomal protein S18 acetylase RimI-like enzyme